jgi:hypothetical protein
VNANAGMLVISSPISTLLKPLQPLNAFEPSEVIADRFNVCRDVQPTKLLSPIEETADRSILLSFDAYAN